MSHSVLMSLLLAAGGTGRIYSYREIAADMGTSWQYVQQIELRAMAKLRRNPKALKLLREMLRS